MPRKHEFDWMRQQLNGFMRTQIIGAAANLSLADHFATAPHSVDDIAAMTGLDRRITFRLLRALAAIGLVASDDESVFRSLPPLETLRSTAPGSLRDLAMVFATPAQYLPWAYFAQSIKTGLPQASIALGSHITDYYARHPEEATIFHKAMQASTVGVTTEIAQRLDTTKSLMAVDVGGATGSLLHSLMEVNPNLHGIVYDRPANVPKSQAAAISLGLSERSTAIAGDFFESVPNGDLHLLRFILHDWSDEDCVRILGNCRRAMASDGRLVVVESFLGRVGQEREDDIADTQGAIVDLHMLVVAGGRERSISEYVGLLHQAGLATTATTLLPSGYVLMEAVAHC
jgi:hypothetical protein